MDTFQHKMQLMWTKTGKTNIVFLTSSWTDDASLVHQKMGVLEVVIT